MNANVSSAQIIARRQKKQEVNAGISQQKKYQRMDSTDAGITKINRDVKPSIKQAAAAMTRVKKPAQRRWQRSTEVPGLPNPPGYQLAWMRKDNRYRGDGRGVSACLREGWEFARLDDIPNEHSLPTQNLSTYGEVIGTDDMVLMKITEDMYEQRKAYYNNITKRTNEGIRQELEQSDNGVMPLTEKRIRSKFQLERIRRKRRENGDVVVAEDELSNDDE